VARGGASCCESVLALLQVLRSVCVEPACVVWEAACPLPAWCCGLLALPQTCFKAPDLGAAPTPQTLRAAFVTNPADCRRACMFLLCKHSCAGWHAWAPGSTVHA
jgi:hypothetical protein